MGDTLNETMLLAFADELGHMQKEAINLPEAAIGAGRFIKNRFLSAPKTFFQGAMRVGRSAKGGLLGEEPGAIFRRVADLPAGLREGWKQMSPAARVNLSKVPGEGGAPLFRSAQEAFEKANPEQVKEIAGRGLLGGFGKHHLQPSVPLREAWGGGGLKGVSEELSRRGWTGGQNWSKYLPIGEKALIPGFATMAIPDIVNAPKASPTGEGGALELGLGQLGGAAGMVLGGGLGFAPAVGGWYLANRAGEGIGRILDRLRSGGGAEQALFAPSPTEAAQQLATIQRHYGGG